MSETIGVVVFSFALAKNEPNPCNRRLAKITTKIVLGATKIGTAILVAQWEVALGLHGVKPELIVNRIADEYLDSEDVMERASECFKNHNITKVIVVANPFLHLYKCKKLAKQAGFEVLKQKIPWVGFYRDSLQWWTRGPMRLFLYAILQAIGGQRGGGRE